MESDLSIGLMLYQARVARDMLISQVARAINIRPTILDALEKNEFERIGAIVYVRGYLKRYAIFLELNYEDLDAQLKKIQQNSEPVILMTPRKKQTPYLMYYGIALMFVFIGAGYHYWLQYNGVVAKNAVSPIVSLDNVHVKNDTQSNEIKNQVDNTQPIESQDKQVDHLPVVDANDKGIDNQLEKNNKNDHDTELYSEPLRLRSSNSITDDSQNAVSINNNLPLVANDSSQILASNDVGLSSESKLVIVVDGDNWTEIRDVTGKKLFSGILVTGQTHVTVGSAPFSIKFGNVQTVVSMSYNGVEVAQDLIKVNATTTVHRMIVGEKL